MSALGIYPLGALSLTLGIVAFPFALRRELLTQVRGRLALAASAAGLLFTVLLYLGTEVLRSSLGVVAVASPGLACAAAIATFAMPRWRVPAAGPVRTAGLATRDPAGLARRSGIVTLAVLVAVLVAGTVIGGLTASADDMGRPSREFCTSHGDLASCSGPYAGWYYGVPALVGLAILLVALALGLRRLAYLPALFDDAASDSAWRRTAAHALVALAAAAVLLYIAAFAMLLYPAPSSMADIGSPGPWGALKALAVGVIIAGALGAAIASVVSVVNAGYVGRGIPARETAST